MSTLGATKVLVDPMGFPRESAEGAVLGSYRYFGLKTSREPDVEIECADPTLTDAQKAEWFKGIVTAESQNIARRLGETPANYMTAEQFCNEVDVEFTGLENTQIFKYTYPWSLTHF
jgi:leucyl aminopeptidase